METQKNTRIIEVATFDYEKCTSCGECAEIVSCIQLNGPHGEPLFTGSYAFDYGKQLILLDQVQRDEVIDAIEACPFGAITIYR